MISFFSTILGLSYVSKIHLSERMMRLTGIALVTTIIAVTFLVIYGLCNAMIAVLDLSAAITIITLLLLKTRTK